jgi:histidinol-phosphate aminotransferase
MVVLPDAATAERLTEDLLHAGVIVRPLASFGLPACIRVSTGTDDEITFCLRGFEQARG